MPRIQQRTYKSPAQTHVANSVMRFLPWVPQFGPSGGRNVIDKIEAVYNFTDLTIAGTAVEGEDVWRALESVVVEQVDGVQRYQGIQGDALRIFLYQCSGAGRVPEFADIAIAANQSLSYWFPIPLAKRFAKRPTDFSLPAELLKEVRIGCALAGASTGMTVAGGTSTITAANMYLLAHTHEEFAVERKSVDQVSVNAFPSTAGITLKIGGRLQDLIVYARAAVGGGSTTGLTELRIDGLLPDPLLRTDLLRCYLADHQAELDDANAADGSAVFNDPVGQGRAVPVLYTTEDTSPWDGDIVDDVIVRVTSGTLASALAITRHVLPASEQLMAAVNRKHGLTGADFRMKTVRATKRDPAKWDPSKEVFATKSAPLKRRGLAQ